VQNDVVSGYCNWPLQRPNRVGKTASVPVARPQQMPVRVLLDLFQHNSQEDTMNSESRNAYRCFRRVQEYLAANPLADAPVSLGRQLEELNAVVGQLTAAAADQEAGARLTRAETQRQRELREQLWSRHMLVISRIAREVLGLQGMDKALRLPKKLCAHETVLAAADAMAEASSKQQESFIQHGLPADFVQQLRAATAALRASLGMRDGTRRRKMTATAGLGVQLKRGKRAVRMLNAILAPYLAADPERLAAWNSVRRVQITPGGPATVADTEPLPKSA
jgi:hypothetical protein